MYVVRFLLGHWLLYGCNLLHHLHSTLNKRTISGFHFYSIRCWNTSFFSLTDEIWLSTIRRLWTIRQVNCFVRFNIRVFPTPRESATQRDSVNLAIRFALRTESGESGVSVGFFVLNVLSDLYFKLCMSQTGLSFSFCQSPYLQAKIATLDIPVAELREHNPVAPQFLFWCSFYYP